jgi:oligoendopeptidase F
MEHVISTTLDTKRNFLHELFSFENWNSLAPYYEDLLQRNIASKEDLEQWLLDKSELESAVEEDGRWRYIRITCNTNDLEAKKAYEFFINEIKPHLTEVKAKLNHKLITNEFTRSLDRNSYFTFLSALQSQIHLHEEINIEALRLLELQEQEYPVITSNLTIEHEGNEITLPAAHNLLQDKNRSFREEIYRKINDKRLQQAPALDKLFSELVAKRTAIATNVGFSNYRDYRMTELVRMDYTPYDCAQFYNSIKECFLPLVNSFSKKRRESLKLDTLRPWDLEVEIIDAPALTPFTDSDDLVKKTEACLNLVHPYFGACLSVMKNMGRLDLDSRVGKAPGGYNMSLPESNVPFIFMNAVSSVRDLITMVHESGHAVHSFLSADLTLKEYKDYPSEIAEVASMSMELFTMEHWQLFFNDEQELNRAKLQLLQRIASIFLWVATIDKFQHWIYTNPTHTEQERAEKWQQIFYEFSSPEIDYTGLEEYVNYRWQAQIHLYELPFYYIEYAIAQLGALAMWKQYKEAPEQAIENYMAALKLGYTKPLKELFATGGIKFDFSKEYIQTLTNFLQKEMDLVIAKLA